MTYMDYSRARVGWFLGLSGPQLATVAVLALPVAGAISVQAWATAGLFALGWAGLTVLTVVRVRGRSAPGWLAGLAKYAAGGLAGWSRFSARAATGQATALADPDLPGVLQAVQIHEGPPHGHSLARTAIIQHHGSRAWAVTARLVHPGLGLCEPADRARYGLGLSELLEAAARTGLVSEVIFLVRTVSEDGAERDQWIARHRRPGGPAGARCVNGELQAALTGAAVRTEAFVTVVVPESRLGRPAREAGGGLSGRVRVLHQVATEVEAQLRALVGAVSVDWLTSPELAVACRTGFAPGDRVGIIDALARAQHEEAVNAEVPWALAGPSGAEACPRHYSHDAWNSVSATLLLPDKGAAMGALAPVLTSRETGERRSLAVCYPIVPPGRANRNAANREWAADLGQDLRTRIGKKQGTRAAQDTDKARREEAKLARGNTLTLPYAVATVTVPKTVAAAEAGRRLDAAIRAAGFAPLRLDLAHDVAFAASTVPMGVTLGKGT